MITSRCCEALQIHSVECQAIFRRISLMFDLYFPTLSLWRPTLSAVQDPARSRFPRVHRPVFILPSCSEPAAPSHGDVQSHDLKNIQYPGPPVDQDIGRGTSLLYIRRLCCLFFISSTRLQSTLRARCV